MWATRMYLLMTAKHGSIDHPMFWGYRTNDNEKRSFGGYTDSPVVAELYTIEELKNKFNFETLPSDQYWTLRKFDKKEWLNHENLDDVFVIRFDELFEIWGPTKANT